MGTVLAQGVRADRLLHGRRPGGHAFGRRHCTRASTLRQGDRQGEEDSGRPCRIERGDGTTTGRVSTRPAPRQLPSRSSKLWASRRPRSRRAIAIWICSIFDQGRRCSTSAQVPGVSRSRWPSVSGAHGRVVAVDPSAPLGAYAREAAARSGVGDILEWRVGRAEELPLPDGAFDRSFCRWVLLHVDAAEAVIREMRRVTRPGGRRHVRRGRLGDRDGLSGRADADAQDPQLLQRPAHRGLERTPARTAVARMWDCRRFRAADRHGRRRFRGAGVGDVPAPARRYGGFSRGGEPSRGGNMAEAIDQAVARRRYFFSLTQFAVWGNIP